MGPSSSIASSKVPSQRPSVSSAPALSPASFAPKSQPAAAPPLPLPPNTSINAPPASLSPTVLHIAPCQRSQPELPILLVGISGSPSSGKTTLSHLLTTLFPPGSIAFNFRKDDFLFPSKHLSNTENADHHMAIDFDALIGTLRAVKEEGRLPADWKTTQRTDTEGMGTGQVPRPEVVDALRKEVADSLGAANHKRKIGIVAGSLLYHDPVIMEMLDVKLLLRVSKAAAKERRFIRRNSGTPAVREFWRTPEFYDKVAWPTFVK
ncbi:MAG: ribosylnicotinamide kinase, partial [Pleopsidium flavum]